MDRISHTVSIRRQGSAFFVQDGLISLDVNRSETSSLMSWSCLGSESRKDYTQLTIFRRMVISIKQHTIKSGWSIFLYCGITGYNFQNNIVFLSLKIDFRLQTRQTLMKCRIMRHFIWAFAVYQNTISTKCKVKRYNSKGDNISTKRASSLVVGTYGSNENSEPQLLVQTYKGCR